VNKTQNIVYRDTATNRLIPQKIALQHDPSTWTEEKFSFSSHPDSDHVSSASENPAHSVGEDAR